MCAFINGLPTICLIRFVNETPSNLTRTNKELQQKASCCHKEIIFLKASKHQNWKAFAANRTILFF